MDVALEFLGDLRHRRPVLRKSRLMILLRPETQRFAHFERPTERGGLNPYGEPMGEVADELQLIALQQRLKTLRGDLATLRLERVHTFRPKILHDHPSVLGMLGGIHAVRNGEMSGCGVAEGVGIHQHANDILVPKHGPAEKVAVRNRTALTHLVVGSSLITLDGVGFRVPIRLQDIVHGRSFLIVLE
ncbi:MAG: hypothetical protein V5B35_19365 [Candidatus Accumulibacter necessarius]